MSFLVRDDKDDDGDDEDDDDGQYPLQKSWVIEVSDDDDKTSNDARNNALRRKGFLSRRLANDKG